MGRRLLIAGSVLALVVLAVVLWLGDDATERSAPPTAGTEPESEFEAPVPVTDGTPTPTKAALADAVPTPDEERAARATSMRRDAGARAAMAAASAASEALADPMLYETEHERARREEAQRHRRWRNLNLVESLIIGITEGIEKARAAGDTERVASLEASKGRLEARRDALREALRGTSPEPR